MFTSGTPQHLQRRCSPFRRTDRILWKEKNHTYLTLQHTILPGAFSHPLCLTGRRDNGVILLWCFAAPPNPPVDSNALGRGKEASWTLSSPKRKPFWHEHSWHVEGKREGCSCSKRRQTGNHLEAPNLLLFPLKCKGLVRQTNAACAHNCISQLCLEKFVVEVETNWRVAANWKMCRHPESCRHNEV